MARGRKRSRVIDNEAEEVGGEGEEEEDEGEEDYDEEEDRDEEDREEEDNEEEGLGGRVNEEELMQKGSSQRKGLDLGGKWTKRGARLPRIHETPPSPRKTGNATIHSFFQPRSRSTSGLQPKAKPAERLDATQSFSLAKPAFPMKTPPASVGEARRRLLGLAEDCGFSLEAAEACLARMEEDQAQLRSISGAGGSRGDEALGMRRPVGGGGGEGGAGEWLGPMSVETWGDEFLGSLADWSSQAVPHDPRQGAGGLGTPAKGKHPLEPCPEGQASPHSGMAATQAEDFDLEDPVDDDIMFLGAEEDWYTGGGPRTLSPSTASVISNLRRSEAALGSADAERPWKDPAWASGGPVLRFPPTGLRDDPFMSPLPTSSLATGTGPGSLASEASRHRTLSRTGAERDLLSGREGELQQGTRQGLLGLRGAAAPPTAGSAVCHRTASRTGQAQEAPHQQRHQSPLQQQQQQQQQPWRVPGVPGASRLLYHEAVAMDQLDLGNAAVFGHRTFRARQREACEAVLGGHDCFVLMPTGGGKSLCYQLPAILSPGVSVVVSPLLSLIQDQVMALVHSFRIPAAFLSSQLTLAQTHTVMRELRKERPTCKLLYVTPEKVVGSPAFQNVLRDLTRKGLLARFVIDEAHCISDWGHDFRPEYSQLSLLRTLFPSVPIVALTATATPQVREEKDAKDPLGQLADLIDRRFYKQSGIVYCLSKSETETVAEVLRKGAPDGHGQPRVRPVRAQAYHAGMPGARRALVQGAWKAGEVDVICATIAFGMGIDKPDVRFVIHNSMSKAVEAFYQESGRAGRDGEPATSVVLYGPRDMSRIVCLLRLSGGRGGQSRSSRRSKFHHDLERAKQMQAYCQDKDKCRRWVLLNHFGEVFDPPHCRPGTSHCDICRAKS